MKKYKNIITALLAVMLLGTCLTAKAKEKEIHLEARSGSLFYDESGASLPVSRAISAPTQEAPYYPFTGNWSNTVNYTYTKYYFKTSLFDAYASGSFTAAFYLKDGTYSGSISASKQGDQYHVAAYTTGMPYYYVILTNTSGSPAKNATYVAEETYD